MPAFDDLAGLGKNLPEPKKIFGNYILENSLTLFPSERGSGENLPHDTSLFISSFYRQISFWVN